MDDYELDDTVCPRCGHEPTHSRRCINIGCDDGWIDMHNDDPLWYDPSETERCEECHGTGIERWCPACGLDLQREPQS
jgi:hypothetical protein